jgi:hypothetical protein
MSKLKVRAMSAVIPKADIDRGHWNVRFVPIADIIYSITSSARPSSDGGDTEAECFGSREIYDQFHLGDLLHRQVGGLLALEDAADVDAN